MTIPSTEARAILKAPTGREPLVLNIPIPPSVNGAYANIGNKGRVKTAKLKGWLAEAGWKAKTHLPKPAIFGDVLFPGPVTVSIELRRPSPNSDLDNRCKAILDLLTISRVWKDDKQVSEIRMRWADDVDGCRVTVTEVAT